MSSRAKKENATKLNRQEGVILLDTFELTNSASRNMLISNVKQMYEKGNIRTLKEAEGLIKLIQENKLEEFDTRFSKIEKTENTKVAKQKAEERGKDADYTILEKESPKYIVKIKNKTSELPTFEVKFKKVHSSFEAAWKDGVAKLVNIAAEKIREKQNLKVVVGVEFTIMKPIEGDAMISTRTIHAHTMPEAVYSEDAVTKFI